MWLQQKKLVIIGGTTGMGLSAAKAFIREGANVVVVGRDQQHCRDAEIQLGEHSFGIAGDASTEGVAELAVQRCTEKFGGFDGLYHVAGGSGRKFGDGPLHELTLEGWNKTIEINLTSLMLSNRAAIRQFLKTEKGGTVLNMGSVLGSSPSPEYFTTHAYAATKSAVIGFTKSIASFYANKNIRINVVAPSLIETPMAQRAVNDELIQSFIKTKQPLDGGRMGKPEDLDGIAVYFMSDHSKFTTGQVITIDGGWSVSEGQH